MKRRSASRIVAAATVLALAAWPVASSAATRSTAAEGSAAFSKTVTLTRTHLLEGAEVEIDKRKVSVSVSQTTGLRDRQGIDVSWTGARPSANVVADPHAAVGRQQEYPVVLLQCRGLDDAKLPTAKRVRPESCWTGTAQERYFQSYSPTFPAWRMDRHASAHDRQSSVGGPEVRPPVCGSTPPAERWLPFVAATGKVFSGGPVGCAGIAPEAAKLDSTIGLPSNTTYGVTGLDGRGQARFDVRDAINNGSLGCSSKVACSLVVIPIMGISCDLKPQGLPAADTPTGAALDQARAECNQTGHKPGSVHVEGGEYDRAVSGALWWSESNWRNRISVPLEFAQTATACKSDGTAPVDVYGSEILVQATTSWLPKLCSGPGGTSSRHVQVASRRRGTC